jgi:exodeoxyribonuclease VIII
MSIGLLMTHIMIDLETLSTAYNARIIAIGAAKFAVNKGIYDVFYQAVKIPQADLIAAYDKTDDYGFHISSDTIDWWESQDEKAKTVFTDPNAVDIAVALAGFSKWAKHDTERDDIRIWGNGASFDNVVLSTAYALCDIEQPWRFWNDRCYRTVKNLYPHVPCQRFGVHHNALDDAETQATHLLNMGAPLG